VNTCGGRIPVGVEMIGDGSIVTNNVNAGRLGSLKIGMFRNG
jgi:hypothetical protein